MIHSNKEYGRTRSVFNMIKKHDYWGGESLIFSTQNKRSRLEDVISTRYELYTSSRAWFTLRVISTNPKQPVDLYCNPLIYWGKESAIIPFDSFLSKFLSVYLYQQNTGPFRLGLDFISPVLKLDFVSKSAAEIVMLHTSIVYHVRIKCVHYDNLTLNTTLF